MFIWPRKSVADLTRPIAIASASLLLWTATSARAGEATGQNWPQWRGPLATGVAPESNPPSTWSESSNIKWKVKIPGNGSATPVIWDRFVFIQTAIPKGEKAEVVPAGADSGTPRAEGKAVEPSSTSLPPFPRDGRPPPGGPGGPSGLGGRPGGPGRGPGRGGPGGGGGMSVQPTTSYQFVIFCLDRDTGKSLWQKTVRDELPHEGHHPTGTFANNSPITDGKHVFAHFGSRGLHCYDMQGNLIWEKDLGKMQTIVSFGEGSSPALFGDTLVVNWDCENGSFIVAMNALTGEERWREKRDERTSWATPLIVEHEGKPQVITAASKKVRSYDLATGKLLWECGGLTANVIPSPVAENGIVYVMSGFKGQAAMAIRLGGSGDLTGSDAVTWTYAKNTPYVPSPLLYGDKLYFFSVNTNVFSCLDAKSGKPAFETQRVESLRTVYPSPVGAGGKIYLSDREGTTVVLKQSDKYEVLSTNRLEETFDASPAVAGKEIFLRGLQHLYCIAEK